MTKLANSNTQPLGIYEVNSGDFDEAVTPELMRSLGFDVHSDEKGNFQPLSVREMDLLNHSDFIKVGEKNVIRWISGYLVDDKKVFNFSDDDYSEDGTVQRTLKNYNESREVFKKMAAAFEVELSDERTNHDNGDIGEYFLDIYVPFDRLKDIENKEQLLQFFKTCSFDSPESIECAIKAVVSSTAE